MKFPVWLPFLAVAALAASAAGETLERVVSREDPGFDCATAGLAAGRDGNVYLFSTGPARVAYVMRIGPDGTEKSGGQVAWNGFNEAAANADGVVATANAHFTHSVITYDKKFQQIGACADFKMPGSTSAPTSVCVGASGDFYGLDHVANRVLRVGPTARIVQAIEFKDVPRPGSVRVSEAAGQLYVAGGALCVIGFDGVERWRTKLTGPAWAVDDAGTVYSTKAAEAIINRWSAAGEQLSPTTLAKPKPGAGSEAKITHIAILGTELLVRRNDPKELFQVYDLASGAFKRSVASVHERVGVEFPSLVWTAGEPVPFTIDAGGGPVGFRVWAAPFGDADWRELRLKDGRLGVPADCAGLYQVRVAPTLNAAAPSEYALRTAVEVRGPGSRGTASVWTPFNRVHWARGEAIPFSLEVRTKDADAPGAVTVSLRAAGAADGEPLWSEKLPLTAGKPATATIPADLTEALAAGRYALRATLPGFTCVAQPLQLGLPLAGTAPFRVIHYADYANMNSTADLWDFADKAVDILQSAVRLGVNQFVNRTNFYRYPTAFADSADGRRLEAALQARLAADPAGTSPQKAAFGFAQAHVLGGFSGHGIREWLMLVTMDDSLPLPVEEAGKKESRVKGYAGGIRALTPIMLQFPAFAGWDWVANWWANGGARFASPTEKTEYEAALKQAKATGEWASILDTVGDRVVNWQPEAQQYFKDAFDEAIKNAGGHSCRTASSGPYRRPEVYPPVCFANVDEVDLHYQAEQITTPNWTPHAVDFYKRPGKPAWIHPEFLGDTGTGEQILPMAFLALMRGADGIGKEGTLPQWGPMGSDPRSAYAGMPGVYRGLYRFARTLGPWLQTLANADTVAIPVSYRHIKLEGFDGGLGGVYFSRLWTAYQDCLYARRPATFIFAEDEPDLSRFKAVLLVGLQYEPEPAFVAMVDAARKAGAHVFADASCRETLVKDATPLGFAFSEKLGGMNDDMAYWTCEKTFRADAPRLAEKLAGSVPAVAEIDAYGVLPTLRRGRGGGRFLWLVNNTRTTLEPGMHWRVSAGMAATMPVITKVRVPVADGEVVYDVFDGKEVAGRRAGNEFEFEADLRFTCGRLFAILPTRIGGVTVEPPQAKAGGPVAFDVTVWRGAVPSGADGGKSAAASKAAIKTVLPVRVALLDGDGGVVEERFTTTGSGTFTAPVNGKAPFTVTATELVSGMVSGAKDSESSGDLAAGSWFGPRLRDIALSADGRSALLNAFSWGQNLYSIDVETGKPEWTGTIGDHFAFSPVPWGQGFAAQGFDLATGEGYHLYALDGRGAVERRFALPGLPARMVAWCFTPNLNDRIANFAVSPDGDWVAAAGNLALAAWKPDGTSLWSEDWSSEMRQSPCLLAVDAKTLLVAEGLNLRGLDLRSGEERWEVEMAGPGEIQGLSASADGKTIVVRTSTRGGRLNVVRDGKVVSEIPAGADAVAVAPDGSWLAATTDRSLKAYSSSGDPQWSFLADSVLRFPRAAADGRRLAVASELGTLHVIDIPAGRVLHEVDLGAVATTAWLADGGLLAATWMGTVRRFDTDMKERWRVNLSDERLPGGKTSKPSVPTARITSWVNAESKPLPLAPNLLDPAKLIVVATAGDRWTGEVNTEGLFDGRDEPPKEPRLDWFNTSMINSGWRGDFSLVFDTFREQLRVDAITLVEDPAHPESWFRDARLEYWDVARGRWVFAHYLTSDGPVHTHRLAAPIEARKFRLTKPDAAGWGTGGLRLAEVVFHGESLGGSHPDVQANRPVAVLLDEEKTFTPSPAAIPPFPFEWRTGPEAASGAACMVLKSEGSMGLLADRRFGQSVTDWDFRIVEKPRKPGEYRWLQFSCKPLAESARGCTLILGWSELNPKSPGNLSSFICLDVGESVNVPWPWPRVQLPDRLKGEWTDVRVDLWKAIQVLPEEKRQGFRVQGFGLMAAGGGVAFDRILLGRTVQDLEESKPIKP